MKKRSAAVAAIHSKTLLGATKTAETHRTAESLLQLIYHRIHPPSDRHPVRLYEIVLLNSIGYIDIKTDWSRR
jgi:hypothetical protein